MDNEAGNSQKTHGPWHYDQVIDQHRVELDLASEAHGNAVYDLKGIESQLRNPKIGDALSIPNLASQKDRLGGEVADFYAMRNGISKELERCRLAHPFLIGPATLDALTEVRPEKWQYMENGQLPFNDLFFDFQEPWSIELPFEAGRAEVVGLNLHKLDDKTQKMHDRLNESFGVLSSPTYVAVAHYRSNRFTHDSRLPFRRMNLSFERKVDSSSQDPYLDISGEIGLEEGKPGVRFRALPDRDLLFYREQASLQAYREFGKSEVVTKESFPNMVPLSQLQESSFFPKIPGLLVNIVNYINAHNVQVVSRSRRPRVIRTNGRFIEEPSSRRPFYLITVKSGVVEEERAGSRSYQLNVREAVRGHDRHFRNSDGSIRSVTWIAPFVRGPENAPWRETRYEVDHKELGEKILRERQMYRDLNALS